jgi:hypothetical protein
MNEVIGWISFVVGIASLAFSLWQHHVYSRRIDSLRSSLRAWWGWAHSIRGSIDPEGINKAGLHSLIGSLYNLCADIRTASVALGCPDPEEESERPEMTLRRKRNLESLEHERELIERERELGKTKHSN